MEKDYLANSQDLFESSQVPLEVGPLPNLPDSQQTVQAVPESPPAPTTVEIRLQDKIMEMLSEILKEQKKLKNEISKLRGDVQKIKSQETPSKVSVEGSTIEKEYVNFLKAKFSTYPWINFQDQEIQLMGNKEVDVEGLSLGSLHNYLWKCFLPSAVPLVDIEREHLTLMLRSFCSTSKLFRKGGTSGFSFWTEFQNFVDMVKQDVRQDKWGKLEEKEERRIEKYLS